MSAAAEASADTPELEALFDSIVAARAAPAVSAAVPAPVAGPSAAESVAGDVITCIGRMTRTLHESLRALGHERAMQSAAATIPDARERLAYVVTMTEKAAERALSAIEAAKPIQDKLAADAAGLAGRWDRLHARELSVDEFRALAGDTYRFLSDVPGRAGATNAQLTEVMMAQDFQDLTGQVVKKVTDLVHEIESQLLNVLVENVVPARREDAGRLLNGPVIQAAGRTDIVANQAQVDELLESMGF